MRMVFAVLAGVACAAGALAQAEKDTEPGTRSGIAPDLNTYPQATPQQTLASVLKAVEAKRIDYLVSQLADPEFVDRRVRETGGRFDDLVKEATGKLSEDPGATKLLRRFQTDGTWDVKEDAASVRFKDVADRRAYFRKKGNRWYLENRNQPEREAK
jgi:hypothetical protein